MAYQRTTEDEFIIQGNYGQGWEDVSCYETRQERKGDYKLYRENEPEYPHRMITRRVKVS